MAKDLISYLVKNPVADVEHTVKLVGRLSGYEFKIKPMTGNQFYKYQELATIINPKDQSVRFNSGRFNELVILNHVVEPNFKDASLLTTAGVSTPEQFINKFFVSGELIELSEHIHRISNMNKTEKEMEDEVKNS